MFRQSSFAWVLWTSILAVVAWVLNAGLSGFWRGGEVGRLSRQMIARSQMVTSRGKVEWRLQRNKCMRLG